MTSPLSHEEINPDRVDAKLQWENTMVLAKALNEILFLEKFRSLAPMVAKKLKDSGVVFPSLPEAGGEK